MKGGQWDGCSLCLQLTEIQQAFKKPKHDPAIHPIFDRCESRIAAHIFVASISIHFATGIVWVAALDIARFLKSLRLPIPPRLFPIVGHRGRLHGRCAHPPFRANIPGTSR